ncbi:MAG: GLUG motif-containing protein [Sedimentisphaerales bacterium]
MRQGDKFLFCTHRKAAVIAGIVFCLFSTVFAYSGGSGEPNNPYQIATVSDWQQLMNTPDDWNQCFLLTNDIDLQGVALTPIGNYNQYNVGILFNGVFDGGSHIIRNININMSGGYNISLFGSVSGQIHDLGVEDVNINGFYSVGGLVGYNRGTITSCYATGIVTAMSHKIGGLVGWNSQGTISDCYATCAVTGNICPDVGGLVGENRGGTIAGSYATGAVTGGESVGGLVGLNNYAYKDAIISGCYTTGIVIGNGYVGGLVGGNGGQTHSTNYRGIISDCYTTGIVIGGNRAGGLVGGNSYNSNGYSNIVSNCYSMGSVSGFACIGGLVGEHSGIISNCYSMGTVSGSEEVGGLVAFNNNGNISYCYSMGSVSGNSQIGGLVGSNFLGSVVSSFWDVNTSGQATSAGGEGKTTEEMQTLSTFTSAGWDFSYTDGNPAEWFGQIDEYPILTWQISPADIYTDGRNNFRDFAVFAQYWLREDCRVYNDYCDWADLNFDGSVDYDDLIELMSYWLESGIYE